MDVSTTDPVPGLKDADAIATPTTIPRAGHNISRANISEAALKVLYRLKSAGYASYLVGGGVRDLLLGREPKDFDVVTDARPEQIREVFRNCRLIGRRFRLAHVRFGREIIEVATFRAAGEAAAEAGERLSAEGRILRDNVYGSFEEDAWRRDFTVNCLYYNIRDFSVVDFTGGMQDLEAGLIRTIGEARTRYREDPVRILRALRFAAKLGFRIHPDTEAPIPEFVGLLRDTPPARLFEEVLKLFLSGHALQSFEQLRRYDAFRYLFPETETALQEDEEGPTKRLLLHALENTDARIAEDRPVTPGFLFAALLWAPARRLAQQYQAQGMTEIQALEQAGSEVMQWQAEHVALPRRFGMVAREIWTLQPRLARRRGKRALQMLEHPRFRAAYDFLLLRAQAGEDVAGLAQWWTELQQAGEGEREEKLAPARRGRRGRRRRQGRAAR